MCLTKHIRSLSAKAATAAYAIPFATTKMKKEHQIIIELIESYLEKNPEQRFGQALFNLKINEFEETVDEKKPNYNLRDIYNDDDQVIINRIESQLAWFKNQKDTKAKSSNENE